MSYKPLSQTVTDGQKNPISSDAVHDHVASEISAIPASASLTLNNLTAPTAVNQDLLLNAGKKIRLNSSTDVYSLLHAQQPDVTSTGITTSVNNSTTVNTGSSVTGILRVNDFIKLSGLATVARITTVNSATQIVVTPALGDNTSRTIEIVNSSASFRNSSNVETLSIFNNQLRANHGSVTAPSYSFTDDSSMGMYFPQANRIAFAIAGGDKLRINRTTNGTGNLTLYGESNIDILQTSIFNLRHGWASDTPSTFLTQDLLTLQVRDSFGITTIESSQNFLNMKSFGIVTAATGGHLGGANGAVSYRRFFTGGFRFKIAIGDMGPYGTYGGLFSGKGYELNLSGTSTVTTNGTNIIGHVTGYSGSTVSAGPMRVAGMGIGDRIKLVKSGQPDLILTIIDEATAPVGDTHSLTVNQVVSADYNNSVLVVLPPLAFFRTKTDIPAFEVDYEGNTILNPANKVAVTKNLEISSGDVNISTLGKSLKLATGSNAAAGLAIIPNGDSDVTVSTNACWGNSLIIATNNTSDAHVSVSSKALGSFKIDHGANVTGDQNCAWFIINPADTDAVSFMLTASISDSTQQSAIHQLVLDLKQYNLWSKLTAIYPFVGGSNTAHSYNLKNPAEYQITWNGTVTHDANGITGNGTDGYGETGIAGSVLAQNSNHISIYSRTDSSITATDIGAAIAADATKGVFFQIRTALANNPTRYANYRAQNSVNNLIPNTQGLFISNRQSSTLGEFYRNNVLRSTIATASEALTFPETITIGAKKSGVSIVEHSSRNYAFATIGSKLESQDVNNLYAAIQAFQTALGRNV